MSTARRASLPGINNNGSRRGLRTKTPSVNDLSKKFKNTPKGKRRLEFQTKQPFKDKKIYLDLIGYKKTSSLVARIIELGGKVEEFFSKDITYLITNRKDADSRLSPQSNSTPSPGMSIPSPFPVNKSSSVKGSAWPSPISADSPQSIDAHHIVPKHDTRGKALRKQATLTSTNKFGTSNILTNARTWGISVIQLDKALEKLAEYGPSKAEKQPSSKDLMGSGKKELRVKIRKLQIPFIKVEDQSRNYKPLVKEFNKWPLPNFNTPVGTCPFDSPKKKKDSEHKKREKDHLDVKRQPKKGYCECCCMHYDALDLHLKSDHHKSFAQNDLNYDSLDKLIREGPSLKVFLKKMNEKYSNRSENAKKISEKKPDNPFQTPTKDTEVTNDESVADSYKGRANQGDANVEILEVGTPDNKHVRVSGGKKPNSQAMEEEGCQILPKRRLTRSQLSSEHAVKDGIDNTESDNVEMKIKSSPKPFSQGHNCIVPLEYKNCKNEKDKVKIENCRVEDATEVPSQKASTPDGTVNEKKNENGNGNKVHESIPRDHPSASSAVSFFTNIKSHKSADCDDTEGNSRVLRSQRKSNSGTKNEEKTPLSGSKRMGNGISSDNTDTLTSRDEITNPQAKRPHAKSNASSTDSLPGVSIKLDRCQSNNNKGAVLNDDSKSPKSEELELRESHKDLQDATKSEVKMNEKSTLRENQTFSSAKNGPSAKTWDSPRHDSLVSDEKSGRSTKAEPGSSDEKRKISGVTTADNTQCSAEVVQDFGKMLKANDTPSLFESDNDDNKSFEGFDPPHFEGSVSSELDLSYRIKEIVEYFTSSQEDTLVNTTSDEDDHEHVHGKGHGGSPTKANEKQSMKKKRQPHGIKIILSSKTDDGENSVFKDDESEEEESDNDESSSTVADTTNGEADHEDVHGKGHRRSPTEANEKQSMKKKRQPHRIKIIPSSKTDDDEDSVFKDDESEEEESDNDESSSTVADTTDGEEEDELLSSSALCMDSFTYKRKSCNLDDGDDDEISVQLPLKRRRTTAEDSSTNLSDEWEEDCDQGECGMETRSKTKASTRALSTTEKSSNHKYTDDRMEDASQEDCTKKTRSKTRLSTRASKSKIEKPKYKNDDDNVTIDNLSQDGNPKTSRQTRAAIKKSNCEKITMEDDKDYDRSTKDRCEEDKDITKARRKTRATSMSSTNKKKKATDDSGMEKERQTRCKTRTSKSTSSIKEKISETDNEDSSGDRDGKCSTRASTTMTSTKLGHKKEHVIEDRRRKHATRGQGDTTGDLVREKNLKVKNRNRNYTSDEKENARQGPVDKMDVVSSSKAKADCLTNNDSLSSGLADASCNSDSSFLYHLPPELLNLLPVHMTIEERVKLRTRNKMNSMSTPKAVPTGLGSASIETKIGEQMRKDNTEAAIQDISRGKQENQKDRAYSTSSLTETSSRYKLKIKTDFANMDEACNKTTRLRSRSLNQCVENPTSSSRDVTLPLQRKALCNTSSSQDFTPTTTPVRKHKHWIFDPGHFSSSTPQPIGKAKSKTNPRVETKQNKTMTTRALRNTNKCFMPGDSYEFMDEDVYAFDD